MRTPLAFAFLLAALAAGAAAPPSSPPPDPNATELETIEINPPPNPYDALRNIRKSLPCMGACDGDIIKARESALEQAAHAADRAAHYFLLPAEPKDPTDAQKEKAAQFCQNPGPGMDYYCLR